MKVEYNRQGAARKELVQAISAITGEKAKYLFLPTKAYRIGSIMVWKNGAMECEDGELFQKVVKEIQARRNGCRTGSNGRNSGTRTRKGNGRTGCKPGTRTFPGNG